MGATLVVPTFVATSSGKALVAQRGKAKQKRTTCGCPGWGLVVPKDGGLPLTWHAYPGDRRDVTQFPDMITQLKTATRRSAPPPGNLGTPRA